MKKLKYIICDMDGTLLNDERKISRKQADYLRNLCGRKQVRFGLATGRELSSLIPMTEEAGILDVCDVMVVNNGADIYDVKNRTKTGTLKISVEDVHAMLAMVRPYGWLNAMFHNPKGLFALYDTPRIHRIVENNHYDGFHSPYSESFEEVSRFTLVFEPEQMEDVRGIVAGFKLPPHIRGIQSDKDVYDFLRVGVSKEEGIRTYVSSQGDTMEDVLVFGDEENDLGMMRAAGVSVAMKNASEKVKENASHVTERTNNEDGIMHFLRTAEDWF